jgi:Protein of unknown function (DUF2442)
MMIHDLVFASYEGEYKIEVRFDDGQGGVVDFSRYLDKGGVFDRFKDISFFKNFKINEELGVLTWQDEIDIAPETLYAEATRTALPNWMEKQRKPSANKAIQRRANSRR